MRPDLWCFGKVIGGGLPLAAFGGPALMDNLAPLGPVYQAGTLSGNPLATAAGLAVLAELDVAAYQTLSDRAERLAVGLAGAISQAGWGVQVPRVGPLVGLFLDGGAGGSGRVTNYDQARAVAGNGRYGPLFHGLLDRGVALAPGPYEALFPSLAHTDIDIDRTITAAGEAVSAVVTAGVGV